MAIIPAARMGVRMGRGTPKHFLSLGRNQRFGMFWTFRGANAIIALRCNRLSGRFEDYWESQGKAA